MNAYIFYRRRLGRFGNHREFHKTTKKFDSTMFFFNHRKSVNLATNTISNVGRTTVTLLVILSFVALAIVNLNNGKDVPIVNQPDIDEFIVSRIESFTSLLELLGETIRKPFAGKQHLYNEKHNVFVCPEERKNIGLLNIVTCPFLHADFVIHNVLEGIPSYGKNIFNALGEIIHRLAPEHFVVEEA